MASAGCFFVFFAAAFFLGAPAFDAFGVGASGGAVFKVPLVKESAMVKMVLA